MKPNLRYDNLFDVFDTRRNLSAEGNENTGGGSVDPVAARAFVSDFHPDPEGLKTLEDSKVIELHGRLTSALDKHRPVKDWKADITDANLKKIADPFKSPLDAIKKLAEPAPDWRADLPDDMRKRVEKFSSKADLVKSYAELEAYRGQSIKLPGEKATAEEISEFNKKWGVLDPDKYEFKLPAGQQATDTDKAFHGVMGQIFNKAGLNAQQAAVLNEGWNAWVTSMKSEMDNRVQQDDEKFAKDSEAALRKEWGQDWEKNKGYADTLLATYGSSDVENLRNIRTADGRYLLDNPLVLKLLANAGRAVGEDTMGAVTAHDKQTLQERLSELMKKPDYWSNDAIQREVKEINDKLYKGDYQPGSAFVRGAA